jgi:hypothetical protein
MFTQPAVSLTRGTSLLRLPRVSAGGEWRRWWPGNTMAPCSVIGERAGEILLAAYGM